MSVTATPPQKAALSSPLTPGSEIEASCCFPLVGLFGGAVLWLFLGLIFALINSLRFHNPHLFADESFLSYGRVHAAQVSAILYGFGVPCALGSGLYLICRLGRTPLAGSVAALLGMVLWNSAVTVGVIAVLCGGGTGFESFDLPAFVSVPLLVAYLLIGISGLLTFHNRTVETLYPSQWFVLGSLFWFPWIFSTATAMLLCMPARGVMQPIIAWWYAHNFSTVFLGFAGLGAIFYFIPKLIGRPLHNSYVAALAFWTLALFGSCGGIPNGSPLPSWIVSLALVGTVLTAVPLLAVGWNLYATVRTNPDALDSHITLRFTYVAMFFWLIAGIQQIVGVLPNVSAMTDYTWFGVAHWELYHYGFFALAMFGAMYYILPRLIDSINPPAWKPGLVKLHFWFTLVGVIIAYLALVVGGIGEGYLLSNPAYDFNHVMAGTLMALRLATMGDLLLVIGTIFFLLNIALLLSRYCWNYCSQVYIGIGKERS